MWPGAGVLEDQVGLGARDGRVAVERVGRRSAAARRCWRWPRARGSRWRPPRSRPPAPPVAALSRAANSRHRPARVGLQPDGDHGLQVVAEGPRVDVGVVAADHAGLAQCPDPGQAGRLRDADPVGQVLVGDPGVVDECAKRARSVSSSGRTSFGGRASARPTPPAGGSGMAAVQRIICGKLAGYRQYLHHCAMRIGVPREVKNHEYRVALTPSGAHELIRSGHEVLVEQGAGLGSSITDADFEAVGALIVGGTDDRGRRGLGGGRPAAQGQGADRRGVPPPAPRARCCSPTCTSPRPGRAPRRCSTRAPPRSPTRPSGSPTARCRCSRR